MPKKSAPVIIQKDCGCCQSCCCQCSCSNSDCSCSVSQLSIPDADEVIVYLIKMEMKLSADKRRLVYYKDRVIVDDGEEEEEEEEVVIKVEPDDSFSQFVVPVKTNVKIEEVQMEKESPIRRARRSDKPIRPKRIPLVSQPIARKSSPVETGIKKPILTFNDKVKLCLARGPSQKKIQEQGLIRLIFQDGFTFHRTSVSSQLAEAIEIRNGVKTIYIPEKKAWFNFWRKYWRKLKPMWHRFQSRYAVRQNDSGIKELHQYLELAELSFSDWYQSLKNVFTGFRRPPKLNRDFVRYILDEANYL